MSDELDVGQFSVNFGRVKTNWSLFLGVKGGRK